MAGLYEKFAVSAVMTSLRLICPPCGHKEALYILLHFFLHIWIVIFMKITRKRRNIVHVYSTVTAQEDGIWETV
jgi:hypothetical protein